MPRTPIKPLLIDAFERYLPCFRPFDGKRGHWFRHEANGVHEIVVCSNSTSLGRIEFDLYAGVFPNWEGAYGSHLLSSGLRLDNLRYNSRALDVKLIGYRYDQAPDGLARAVLEGAEDLRRFAIPFFERFRHDLVHHQLSKAAFNWLDSHKDRISNKIFDEIVADRTANGYFHMAHPIWNDLMHYLRSLNSPQRDEIPILGLHILQLFQERKGDLSQYTH